MVHELFCKHPHRKILAKPFLPSPSAVGYNEKLTRRRVEKRTLWSRLSKNEGSLGVSSWPVAHLALINVITCPIVHI